MRSRLSAGIVPSPHNPVHCPLGKCQLQITYARGSIYEARNERHTIRVEVRSGRCEDARIGPEVFSSNVTVMIDGDVRRGCGREL